MEKDFIKGKCEEKTFNNGGRIYKIWIPKDELERITKDSGINIEIKFGKDSGKPYMENDTWQPSQNDNQSQHDGFEQQPEMGQEPIQDTNWK